MMHLGLRARVVAALTFVVCSSAVSSAGAFCRTTTVPLPPSYNPTNGCYTDGLALYWKSACVRYNVQRDAAPTIPFEDATRIIDDSFATWTGATCPSGQGVGLTAENDGPVSTSVVRYVRAGANENVIVFRADNWPYNDRNNTLGLTTVTFNADTGEIYDADMEINATEGNLTIGDPVDAKGFDLQSVITHEAGHFYGLAHATSAASTMYAAYRSGTSTLRSLADDDVEGMCTIYPSTTERMANSGLVSAGRCGGGAGVGDGGGGGCSASGRPSAAWLLPFLAVVAGALGRRRQRR